MSTLAQPTSIVKAPEPKAREFVLITADFSGSGMAYWEKEIYGNNVIIAVKSKEPIDKELQKSFETQGKGIVKVFPLDEIMKKREKLRDSTFIFDGNHNTEEGEILHKEGFTVFGGTDFQYKCENDREWAIKLAESVGLESPEYHEFKDTEKGIKFLEANADRKFVLKPNGSSDSAATFVSTTVEPENANIELREYMQAVKPTDYILQEMIHCGIEVNVEYLVKDGEPILCHANLENKKKNNGDYGVAVGCMMDVVWIIPVNCKLAEMTVGKFRKYLKEINFSGVFDSNVIISEDKAWFLEFCLRQGWNDSISFCRLMGRSAFQMIDEFLRGTYKPEPKLGFSASLTLLTDKPQMGLPIYFPETLKKDVYLFDAYREDGVIKMGGFSNEVAVVTGRGYTISDAFDQALDRAHKVKFPNMLLRTDATRTDYPSNPIKRFEALMALKLF